MVRPLLVIDMNFLQTTANSTMLLPTCQPDVRRFVYNISVCYEGVNETRDTFSFLLSCKIILDKLNLLTNCFSNCHVVIVLFFFNHIQ